MVYHFSHLPGGDTFPFHRGGAIVIKIKRIAAWTGLILAIILMLLIAFYKAFVLLLGTLGWGVGPLSVFYVAALMEPPAFPVSAVTAWKWPWIAESVAVITLAVILARFNPWTTSPFQRALSLDYIFIIAANVAFFARMSLRRAELKRVGGEVCRP